MLRRIVPASIVLLGAVVAACSVLLPEKYALNAPVRHLIFGRGIDAPPQEAFGGRIRAAGGLRVALYAEGLPGARLLRFTPTGDLLVSLSRDGRIELLERDADGDGSPDGRRALLEGLDRPHGMDLRDGWLYVAEGSAIARVRFDPPSRRTAGEVERIVTGLPSGGNHWTRTLRFGPDDRLYLSVGSSCNVCIEDDPRRAAILRFRPDGTGEEIFARGLRNSVGLDWQPETGRLYATDNGRDLLGNDFPPCELNDVVQGGFYGWPFANGDNVPDPDYGGRQEARDLEPRPPVHAFRPHNAPLGIHFVRGRTAPAAYRGAALVALHGSWNRTRKDGYKVVSLHWRPDGGIEERDFLVGFLEDDEVIGRPVDVAEGPDGAFYVSDDYAGAIYRVSTRRVAAAAPRATAVSRGGEPEATEAGGGDPGAGRRLYERHGCYGCHEAGRAQPGVVVVPLESLASRWDGARLQGFLAAPTPPMPAFDLDAGERGDLAAYLLSAHP